MQTKKSATETPELICCMFYCSHQEPKNQAVVFDGGIQAHNISEQKKHSETEQLEILQRRLAALEKRSISDILYIQLVTRVHSVHCKDWSLGVYCTDSVAKICRMMLIFNLYCFCC